MSAFLCSPRHIATIAVWGVYAAPDRCPPSDRLVKKLLDENIASLEYRYPDTRGKVTQDFAETSYDEFLDLCWAETDYLNRRDPQRIEIPAVSKLIDSYEYQSCEHPGWGSSEMCALCADLSRLAEKLWAEHDDGMIVEGVKLSPLPLKTASQNCPWSI